MLARVGAGDRGDPLSDLYARYARRIHGLGLRMTGDAGMGEDLVQETFVRLWRGAASFDPRKGTARTFIFTIARRAAVDLLRRSASRPLPTVDDPIGLADSLASEDGSRRADQIVLGLEVREAMEALSAKQREVLELCFDDDLSQSQAATRLGVPLGTVKTRCFHALRALGTELREREVVG